MEQPNQGQGSHPKRGEELEDLIRGRRRLRLRQPRDLREIAAALR